MHRYCATNFRELYGVRKEVRDDLAVSTLITKELHEIVLVRLVRKNWPDQVKIFHGALGFYCAETLLDQTDAVQVLINHRERVICHLSLVH